MAIHKLRKRYGALREPSGVRLHRRTREFIKHLEKEGSENSKLDAKILRTIMVYNGKNRPLDYISLIAHCVKEVMVEKGKRLGELDPEDLMPYARSLRRLSTEKSFFKGKMKTPIIEGKPRMSMLNLVKSGIIQRVHGILARSKKELTPAEVLNSAPWEQSEKNKVHVVRALNVLDVMGYASNLPRDTMNDSHKTYAYIHTNNKMPLPENNLGYVMMGVLRDGPTNLPAILKNENLKRFGFDSTRPSAHFDAASQFQAARDQMDMLVDAGLVTARRKGKHKGMIVYTLTNTGKRMRAEAKRKGELTETFRQRLLSGKRKKR